MCMKQCVWAIEVKKDGKWVFWSAYETRSEARCVQRYASWVGRKRIVKFVRAAA